MIKCPCKDCVLIAICRHRTYNNIQSECSLVFNYLYRKVVDNNHLFQIKRGHHIIRVTNIYEALNPTRWDVVKNTEVLNIKGHDTNSYALFHLHKKKRIGIV